MRIAKIAAIVLLVGAGLALPPFTNGYVVNILTQVFLYAFLAGAWNIMALSGLVSLGHAAFFGLGSYTTTWLYLTFGITPGLGWLGGVALAAALAFIVYWIAFRCGLRGIYFGGLTLVLAESLRFAAINSPALGRSQGLELVSFGLDGRVLYTLALALMVGGMALTSWILRSPFGYRLQAIRDNEVAAESMGVNTFRSKLIATALSAGLTALGGTVSALFLRFVEPESDFGLGVSLNLLLGAFLGGTGTVLGPGIGITVLFGLREGMALLGEQVSAGTSAVYAGQQIVYGLILMGVVAALPEGLLRWLTRWRPGWRRSTPLVTAAEGDGALARGALSKRAVSPDTATPVLEVEGVTKSFRGLRALQDVTFTVQSGEILGIIGPNGAGKTTLFNVISGICQPSAGSVRLKGRVLTGLAPSEVCRRGVARTFQIVRPFGALSVLDNVVIGALARTESLAAARRRSREVIDFVGLGHRESMPAGALTLQDRKLLEFARALATAPDLLLLDEVMAGLNQREQERVAGTIRQIRDQGITLLVIEHVIRVVMGLADRLLVLDHGTSMAEGRPEIVARDARVVSAYLGEPAPAPA